MEYQPMLIHASQEESQDKNFRESHHPFYQFKLVQPSWKGQRPLSVATVFVDSDEEAMSSDEGEVVSARASLKSAGGPSITTIDSLDDIPTPQSASRTSFGDANASNQASARSQVEGPRGPHLFRNSFDHVAEEQPIVLSLSPCTPQAQRPPELFAHDEPVPQPQLFRFSNEILEPASLLAWTPDMISQWMLDAGLEVTIAARFLENDVTGVILDTLKFEDLKELGILSFGLRTRVWNHVINLKQGIDATASRLHVRSPTPIEDVPSREVGREDEEPVAQSSSSPYSRVKSPPPPLNYPQHQQQQHHRRRDDNDDNGQPQARPNVARRRVQRGPGDVDIISPLESVSIVGIEATMPQPHHCSKGENCAKYRKQARKIEAFKREYPYADFSTGTVVIGNPGNPRTARALDMGDPTRPMSDAMPSVVASSDVLGPGLQPPALKLHEGVLRAVVSRDPQDNVRQFLHFQHQNLHSSDSPVREPVTPPFDVTSTYRHEHRASLPRLSTGSLMSTQSRPAAPLPTRQSISSVAATNSSPSSASWQDRDQNDDGPLIDASLVPTRLTPTPSATTAKAPTAAAAATTTATATAIASATPRPSIRNLPKLSIPAQPSPASRFSTTPQTAFRTQQGSPPLESEATPRNPSPMRGFGFGVDAGVGASGYSNSRTNHHNGNNASINSIGVFGSYPLRFGTPFSDMDVPLTAIPIGPVARDASQSVPPDMTFRAGTGTGTGGGAPSVDMAPRSVSRGSARRPSFPILPPLEENKVSSVTRSNPKGLRPPPRYNYPWSPVEPRTFEHCIPPSSSSAPTLTTTVSGAAPAPSSSGSLFGNGSELTAVPLQPYSTSSSLSSSTVSSTCSTSTTSSPSLTATSLPSTPAAKDGVIHQGHMKKRKTKFLRHEWQDGFFTLRGTRLAMHRRKDEASRTLEYIDVDDYAIACSGAGSQSKLRAALRAMQISGGNRARDDAGVFCFQLVPQEKMGGIGGLRRRESSASPRAGVVVEGAVDGTGKAHHFAVRSRDDRIDWMRELMLARALKQKGDGFEVSRNGNMI